MSRKRLNHFESYRWHGQFWFPDKEDEKVAGVIEYSPSTGINVEILCTGRNILSRINQIAKKRMFGSVEGADVTCITLINVFLSLDTLSLADIPTIKTFKGSASFLVLEHLTEEQRFENLEVQYEDEFENIFIHPRSRESQVLEYIKNPAVSLGEGIKISMSMDSWGTPIIHPDEIDALFWSNNDEKFQKFKNAFISFISDASFELVKRTSLIPTFKIEKTDSSIEELFEIEDKWRSFWELLIDRKISPINIWLKCEYAATSHNEKYTRLVPILSSWFCQLLSESKSDISSYLVLPINISKFGDTTPDLSLASTSLNKWFSMKCNPQWDFVLYGLQEVLNQKEYGSTARYVSLVSEVETLLNLRGHEKATLDTLIELYASQRWIEQISKILTNKGTDSLGVFLKEVRNVITHPRASKKAKGKYWNIVQDELLFRKLYAYLAALFIKVILIELGQIADDSIEKYVQTFIKRRALWVKLEYS